MRWHWLAFQKSAEARWMNELTVQVALELSRLILIFPRFVLIVAA